MALDTVTLEDALRLLTLPRTLGELDGEPVTVQNGRYGPYVKKGTDSRSLENEEQLFTVTLAEAKELFAQPKARGRRPGAAAPPLRELGEDPASGRPIVIKEGRFGPYVTDGETNASLRRATRWSRSRSSGRSNCSPSAGPRPRRPPPPGAAAKRLPGSGTSVGQVVRGRSPHRAGPPPGPAPRRGHEAGNGSRAAVDRQRR